MAIDFDKGARRAQQQGIDVRQVGESLAHYLSEERRKVRDNPRLLEKRDEVDNLSVAQRSGASRVTWETLGELPGGLSVITVHATAREANANRESVRSLLERRLKREFAWAMARAGMFDDSLEGRREAMRRAMRANVYVADIDLAGTVRSTGRD